MNAYMISAMISHVRSVVASGRVEFPEKKIEQIKNLRTQTSFGLKQSKDIVEAALAGKDDFNLISEAINDNYSQVDRFAAPPPPDKHFVIARRYSDSALVYEAESIGEADRVREFLNDHLSLNAYPTLAKAI